MRTASQLVLLALVVTSLPSRAADDALASRLRALDPALSRASSIEARRHTFGSRTVVRARTFVDELPVLGGDRVAIEEGGVLTLARAPSLEKQASFSLTPAVAIARACEATRGCAFADPTVEDLGGFARAAWLATPSGLEPAFAVRVPSFNLFDARDVVISGADGTILSSRPVVKTGTTAAPTKAWSFEGFAPTGPDADLEAELTVVDLEDLRPAEVGGPLKGYHFETRNCCKQYTCNDLSTTCIDGASCTPETASTDCAAYQTCEGGKCTLAEGTALETVATCAESGDEGAIDSYVNLAIPSEFLPFQLPGIGDTLYAKVAFCTELPRVRSEAGAGPAGEDGWFSDPVDVERATDPLAGLASEEDAFAEVAAYHATQQYFEHVRAVLEDPAFCLEQLSMECDANGDAVLDETGAPVLPFHVSTNVLIPEIDLVGLGQQILGGAGGVPGNPVVIDDFQRIPNAAFIPALEGGPIQIPPELAPLAALFSRPYDSNVYFQGGRDFAYDGDVVRHEFTHAIVHTLNPELLSLSKDEWGSHAEPGSLNEGWSDYFSSSFLDDPQVGEYAGAGLAGSETSLRDNANDKTCPENIEGEVHVDSEPWAGALWEIRTAIGAADVDGLDRALFAAVAASDPDEDFAKASAHAVEAIEAELGADAAAIAQGVFDARALSNCARTHTLSTADGDELVVTRKDQLFQPGAGDVGVSNFAPSVVQLRVDVPAGSAGFTLSWSQAAGGIGGAVGGDNEPEPVLVLVHEGTGPLSWTYEGQTGGLAVPHDEEGAEIDFDAAAPANAATYGAVNQNTGAAPASFTHTLTTDACNARSFVVQFLAAAGGSTMQDIDIVNVASDAACDTGGGGDGDGDDDAPDCGCQGVGDATPFAALMFALLALRRRRR